MPILIVDDAQHLDADAMELVLGLCEENETAHLLSTILFGTPQLQAALASPALSPLQSRVAHTLDVPPFREHDTGRYLRHRMRAACNCGVPIKIVDSRCTVSFSLQSPSTCSFGSASRFCASTTNKKGMRAPCRRARR